jgi:uncharacterized protein (DUF924 family)
MMPEEVIEFWFQELNQKQWWIKDTALDTEITARFAEAHEKASSCELWRWRQKPIGRLAEIILLDQFSRNMFRDSARAFAYDKMALTLAQEAIASNAHLSFSDLQRGVLYLPFMHSESVAIHKVAEQLYRANGLETQYQFELQHQAIIERFGRYPHRNAILGRTSTPAEILFLAEPGSQF